MNQEQCYELGVIAKIHGLKGELVFFLDVDYPLEYENLESVFVEINKTLVPFFIETINIIGNKAIVKLEEINTIDDAKKLCKNKLYLPLEQLPELGEDQFYFHEIIGFDLVDKTLGPIGKVENVYDLPAQSTIVFTYKEKEVLLPMLENTILSIDKNAKKIMISLPQGLLDIYLKD